MGQVRHVLTATAPELTMKPAASTYRCRLPARSISAETVFVSGSPPRCGNRCHISPSCPRINAARGSFPGTLSGRCWCFSRIEECGERRDRGPADCSDRGEEVLRLSLPQKG